MSESDDGKAEFDLLTVVDTGGAWRNQARDIPRDGVIFDALELPHTKCTLYKVITEHKIVSRQLCEVHNDIFYVPLTGRSCNRSGI